MQDAGWNVIANLTVAQAGSCPSVDLSTQSGNPIRTTRNRDPCGRTHTTSSPYAPMFGWIITFLILAILFALLGFGGLAGAFAGIAEILFYVFLILLIISAISRAVRGKTP